MYLTASTEYQDRPDISVDEYLAAVAKFAADLNCKEMSYERYMADLHRCNSQAGACVQFRLATATHSEMEALENHLRLGMFPGCCDATRKAWWLFTHDILNKADNINLEQVCQPYALTQPLFVGAPNLFAQIRRRMTTGSPDLELIDDRAITCIDGSEVYRAGPGYSRLPSHLPAAIPAWARATFPDAPRFVRLHPGEYFQEEPSQRLEKVVVAPANPRWLATLALFAKTQTYAAYELQDGDPEVDIDGYRDFHLRHIRKLEVIAQRRKADYLTMTIEEIPRNDDPNGLMVSRCIHLDTRAPIGTAMKHARLNHLDLSINVYRDDRRLIRSNDSLQFGKVCDATFRTHLFRVEAIPFSAMFTIAQIFLQSRVLLREWFRELNIGEH